MKRLLSPARLAPALALILVAMSPVAAWAEALLRPSAMIDGPVVTLGDLWDNVGAKAKTPIARSPAPGRRVTVNAEWLAQTARAYGVDWRPASNFDQIVVERNGITIDHDKIEQALRAALADEDLGPNAEIELSNRGTEIVVPVDSGTKIGVRDMNYDRRINRFTATLEVPEGSPTAVRTQVAGRIYQMLKVPVLTRPVNRGEVISAADITTLKVRADQVRRDVMTDPAGMVGMTPKEPLRAGQMVGSNDLQKPIAVARGALVTMVLKFGPMTLTAQGRAAEPGAVGDLIRVANSNTNQVVEAKVDGPDLVSVAPTGGNLLAKND